MLDAVDRLAPGCVSSLRRVHYCLQGQMGWSPGDVVLLREQECLGGYLVYPLAVANGVRFPC